MCAAIGVQRDLERKALLGAPARVRPDKGEIVRLVAGKQARHLRDMLPGVRFEIGEDLRVAAVGEGGDLAEDRIAHGRFDRIGGAAERRGDIGNDAERREPFERLDERAR